MNVPALCPLCRKEPTTMMLRQGSYRFGCYLSKPFEHSVVVYAETAEEARARYELAFGVRG